jgi:hypothetical protein
LSPRNRRAISPEECAAAESGVHVERHAAARVRVVEGYDLHQGEDVPVRTEADVLPGVDDGAAPLEGAAVAVVEAREGDAERGAPMGVAGLVAQLEPGAAREVHEIRRAEEARGCPLVGDPGVGVGGIGPWADGGLEETGAAHQREAPDPEANDAFVEPVLQAVVRAVRLEEVGPMP